MLLFLFLSLAVSATGARASEVLVIRLADSINPGSGDYLMEAISKADAQQASYLLIQLDTPGGLLNTTRAITQKMLNSKTPIVVFIGPQGAHAGSAGALITFAADVAVMAPGTNIGAAHPVVPGGQKMDETMAKKMANDTAAFAESLAKVKGRNTEWAVKAVKQSESIIAEKALSNGVIDLMANDVPDLVEKLKGHKLGVVKGDITQLPSEPGKVVEIAMSIKQKLVSFFADPNLAYMIMSLGGLCIWIEVTNPGLIFPGVLGVICILISLISFQLMPISYGALALIFVGMALIVAELFITSFGVLAIGGITAFIVGSLFLMDTAASEFQISLAIILPTAAVLAGSALMLGGLLLRTRNVRYTGGADGMVGEYGETRERTDATNGRVFVQGELWNAVCLTGELEPGQVVQVKEVRSLVLVVEPSLARVPELGEKS